MRGRLFFYCFWFQEARSYLSEFAARQYSETGDTHLTDEILESIAYFMRLLSTQAFLEGVRPERMLNRRQAVIYTDGALEGDGFVKSFLKGIGGVLFDDELPLPLYYGERIDNTLPNFEKIAVIEMYAIERALQLFANYIRGKAIILFVDNTHAIGCLLKRSASYRESHEHNAKRMRFSRGKPWEADGQPGPRSFEHLPRDIRRCMNKRAQSIWRLISELDIILWVEYVNTKLNIADPPSRGDPMPIRATRISDH